MWGKEKGVREVWGKGKGVRGLWVRKKGSGGCGVRKYKNYNGYKVLGTYWY